MGIAERAALFREVERVRGRPLVVYVTSTRPNLSAQMGADAISELLDQLDAIRPETPGTKIDGIDLLVVSNGGDATVAWRMMSLLREKAKHVAVLVPYGAFSAATLLALGADELIMHPHGNLGPTDSQIIIQRKKPGTQEVEQLHFGSEDLLGFLEFARSRVGLTDQEHLRVLFEKFCAEVGTISVGVSMRSSRLSLSLGEKLLEMHMGEGHAKAKALAEALNKNFFHHSYAVGREECRRLGLPVAPDNAQLEDLIWRIWRDVEVELEIRRPFDPMVEISSGPAKDLLLAPVTQLNLPPNAPQQMMQAILNAMLASAAVQVPPTPYKLIAAVMESSRTASRSVIRGNILACRMLDMNIVANAINSSVGWEQISVPA
jgi:hypothetical protein